MRSHVVLLARTPDHRYVVVKQGRNFVLPDSVGQLEWHRHDAKKVAQKLLSTVSYGVLTGTVARSIKFVATKESYRGIEIVFDESLWPILQRVVAFRAHELDRPVTEVRLVTSANLDLLTVESAHMLSQMAETAPDTTDTTTDTTGSETGQSSCASPTE
jgi:hypothetical protein